MKLMPTDYAIVMQRAATEQGVDLLAGLDYDQAALEAREFMPLPDYIHVLERYTALQRPVDWGFRMGQQLTMANHGPLGFGAMCAPTIRDGLVFLCRYMPTRASYTQCWIELHRDEIHVVFRHDPEMSRFLQRICETLCIIFQSFIESSGASTAPTVWRFPYPAPDDLAHYNEWIHGGYSFDAPVFRLELPVSVGMVPSAFRNDAAYKSTTAQCEAILMRVSIIPMAEKVRGILASSLERRVTESVPVTEVPSAEDVAASLQVSRRTLIRRLKEAGTSFQAIKETLLRTHMAVLFAQRELSLGEIAERLGYADAANFTRACRRLFGSTPSELRVTGIPLDG